MPHMKVHNEHHSAQIDANLKHIKHSAELALAAHAAGDHIVTQQHITSLLASGDALEEHADHHFDGE
jgi:hypothetical protein